MNYPPQPPEDASGLRQDVIDWFVRRQREGWSVQDEAAFQAWLASSPLHREGFARWEFHWQSLEAIPADAVARLRHNLARDKAQEAQQHALQHPTPLRNPGAPPPGMSRRRFLVPTFAMAALVAVAGGSGLLAWQRWQGRPLYSQTFSTQRGQQLDVPLPDGSQLRLDTSTRLQVTYYRDSRDVTLHEGQAVFSVQSDAQRPFRVLAGTVAATVLGTRFSVRYTPKLTGEDGVRVSVEEGRVRVSRLGKAPVGAADALELAAGQQVRADAQGRLGGITAVATEGIAPWREHRISFVNTPLSQAIAELERYGNTGLMVRHPAVAALRLSGTFDPRDTRTLRRILPAALPVRLQDSGALTEVVPAL